MIQTRSGGIPRPTPYEELHSVPSRAISVRGLTHLPRKPVCVKTSLLPDAGKGLFAARDICMYADNIRTRAQQIKFKICPYTGDKPDDQPSDYVIRVGDHMVDAWRIDSCWARYANDALDILLDNFTVILINGVIWLIPLPGVEILNHQELYIAYDLEYWYRNGRRANLTCNPRRTTLSH